MASIGDIGAVAPARSLVAACAVPTKTSGPANGSGRNATARNEIGAPIGGMIGAPLHITATYRSPRLCKTVPRARQSAGLRKGDQRALAMPQPGSDLRVVMRAGPEGVCLRTAERNSGS